ncbi:facilitated trehalose transporter Tret1-like [Epargyreus clarus]|uniref:facilitated trehalose transporter Tret1-like n=1 Tax=Epargyreus clarus TaxID=520877 RepID=UPI003C2D23C2
MIKGRVVQYLVAIAVSLATASMGTFSGWPTPVMPKLKNNESDFPVTEGEIGWMLASVSPGFLAGSLVTSFISDTLGRRTALIASVLPMTVGTVIVITATYASMLYVTEFLWGFSTGIVSIVSSIYLAEISDKDLRASLSMITRFTFNFGVLVVMSVGPFLSYTLLNWLLLVLPVCFFVACLWIPESPYYHLKEGRVNRAREGLSRLKGKSGEELESHLNELQADVRKEMQKSSSVFELFSGKQYRRAIIIAVGLKITQILTGTVTIKQYLGLIIKESQMSISYSTALLVFAAVIFVVSFMTSFFVDRVGRVPLLTYSYFGTGVTLVVVGIYFYFQANKQYSAESWLQPFSYVAFIGIILANVISTIGFNSITTVVHSEIFPLNVKSVAMTSLNILGGCLGMVVARGYELIKRISGQHGVFFFFAVISFAGAIFSFFVVPETRGKTLKEIQVILQGELYDVNEDVIIKKDLSKNNGDVENGDVELKALNTKLNE